MLNWIIQGASSYAGQIDNVIVIIAVLGGFWLILAEVALFYFVMKYRRSRAPKAMHVTGYEHEYKKWIHWPHYLVIACDLVILVFAARAWYHVKQSMPEHIDEDIRVVGHQWAWEFVHPGADGKLGTADDINLVDELHVTVNKTYRFHLESADVLHSFSIPRFRLKQDAVPGREIIGWFTPTIAGTYDVPCSQMCGLGHGIMGGRIFVETEAEHRLWLDSVTGKTAANPAHGLGKLASTQGGN